MKPWLRAVIIISIVVVLTPFIIVLKAYKIPAGSMIPTLLVGDHIYVNRWATHPRRGDVAIFTYPKDPSKDFVKRVMAVGGDTIEVRQDVLYLNGQAVVRRAVAESCEYDDQGEGGWNRRKCRAFDEELDGHHYRVVFDDQGEPHSTAPVTVPAGQYFFMGDNRDNSHDSRYFGSVPSDNLRGTALFVWFSWGPDGLRGDRIGKKVD